MTDHESLFSITAWVQGGLGIVVFLICFGVLARDLFYMWCRGRRVRSSGDTVSFFMKLLLPWPPLARACDLLITGGALLSTASSSQGWLTVFLNTMPGYLYVIVYLLLVLFWAWLYTSSKSTHTFRKNVIQLWSIIAAVIVLVWTLFMMAMAAFPDARATIHDTWSALISLLSVAIAVLFVAWSIALVLRLRQRQQPSERTLSIATKIFVLTLGCSGLFFLRGISTSLASFAFAHDPLKLYVCRWVLFVGCDYGSAIFLLAIIFIRSKRRATSANYQQYLVGRFDDPSGGYAWEPTGQSFSSSSTSTGPYPERSWPVSLNTTDDGIAKDSGSFEDPFSTSEDENTADVDVLND